ncbi:EAL domain-containing protein [Pseudooceanicola sp. LIPI14-2-Ac024]|uniref:EAL domain-containing protein n=1 Tax=Pseudooceanicola sp. LIPI14-2-Ac024 TaxID=3344875 RepID=UPI0035CFBA90
MTDRPKSDRPPAAIDPGDPLSMAVGMREGDAVDLVRAAVRDGRLALAYQPIVQAKRPDRIAFYEGLIRIFDPSGRVIPARDFIGAVEALPLGREIDTIALRLGLQCLADQPDIRLSINLSARSIGYPPWMTALRTGLMRHPTVGERLVLELTERSAMQLPEIVTTFMSDLAREGISFALDDFGAGHTCLRHLRQFQFDMLKIDAAFIRGIARDPDNQVVTRAICMIAEQFDMFTVAEAVEREDDARWLTENGLDCLQGYYYAAPTLQPPWMQPEDLRRA